MRVGTSTVAAPRRIASGSEISRCMDMNVCRRGIRAMTRPIAHPPNHRPTPTARRVRVRAAVAADLHADAGWSSLAVPASSTGPRRAAGCTTSPPACWSPTWATTRSVDAAILPVHGLADRAAGNGTRQLPRARLLLGPADDRLQRDHADRGRSEPAAARSCCEKRRAARGWNR